MTWHVIWLSISSSHITHLDVALLPWYPPCEYLSVSHGVCIKSIVVEESDIPNTITHIQQSTLYLLHTASWSNRLFAGDHIDASVLHEYDWVCILQTFQGSSFFLFLYSWTFCYVHNSGIGHDRIDRISCLRSCSCFVLCIVLTIRNCIFLQTSWISKSVYVLS